MKSISFIFAILFLSISFAPSWALAYQEVPVKNGGTITGKILLKGKLPPPRMFLLSMSPFGSFCKKISDGNDRVMLEEFIVSPSGQMSDVIIAVQGVKAGKPFPHITAEILATDCMFHPKEVLASELYEMDNMGVTHHIHPMVAVVQNHQKISVVNEDPILHNGQVYQKERGNLMLNFPLPVSDAPQGGTLDFDPGLRVAQMICGMHEFMQTWGFAVDNPYYAKSNRRGEFVIDKLPPGTYKVHVWYPHFKIIEKEVTISKNGLVHLNLEFDASSVKRRTFESEGGIRSFN